MKLPEDPCDKDFPYTLPPGPFVYERTVRWGDADPHQFVYTGRIPDFGLEAVEAFMKAVIGVNWYEIVLDQGIGTPFVHLACDFKSPVYPRGSLDILVRIERLGRSSITYDLKGYQDGDRLCFSGRFVCAFVHAVKMKPISIPESMRANLQLYVDAQYAGE